MSLVLVIHAVAMGAESASGDGKSSVIISTKDRYTQVVQMPQAERDRLQKNFAEFEKLRPEDQQRYRDLNRELEENKNLSNLMDTYSAWLQTLTPSQREQLRNEKDSTQKLALVRKFKEDQYRPIEALASANPLFESSGHRPFAQRRPLPPAELNAMLKVLISDLPKEEHAKYEKASQAFQYLEILERSIRHSSGGPQNWPSQELADKMVASLTRPEIRKFIKSHKVHERDVIAVMLFGSILAHAGEEVHSKLPKDDPDLDQVYAKLSTEEKKRADEAPPGAKRAELVRRFFDEKGDDSFRHMNELRSALGRLMSQLDLAPDYNEVLFRYGGRGRPGMDDRGGPPPEPPGPPPPRRDRDGRLNGPRRPPADSPPGRLGQE